MGASVRPLPGGTGAADASDGGVKESLEDKVRRVTSEAIEIVDYDPGWPEAFELERRHLSNCFPDGLVVRVEHVGSTAVPALGAKPVIDILIGVRDLAVVRERVVPLLEGQGYDYFWSPTHGDDVPPFYALFIKRDGAGVRTHHIHVVEMDFREHWDWVLFRDHLRSRPEVAARYEKLKRRLARKFPRDRVRYTEEKSQFILAALSDAKGVQGPAGSPE